MLLKAQLHWVGHINQMSDVCIPKQLFFDELAQGQRKQDQSQKCYKDALKSSLICGGTKPSELNIAAQVCPTKPSELNIAAQVCPHWYALIHIASASLEKE